MSDVVGVHGISQQQRGRNQLIDSWQPALQDGIDAAVGRSGPQPTFDLAFYGDFYLPLTGGDVKGGDTESPIGGLDDDELGFLLEAADEATDGKATSDQPAPSAKGPLSRLPGPLLKAAGWLDERLGAAGTVLFFHDLRQVRRYQGDNELADQIRMRVLEAVDDGCSLLIGHSLGSVVAYETVCLHPESRVGALLTLGSPLGLRTVRTRLRTRDATGRPRTPSNLRAWVNIYDDRDPVACAGGVSSIWPGAVDQTVYNGDEPHAISNYLGKKATGQAVVAALDEKP
jgi:hypothetical protein